ncbi:hypothetical protein, partial [Neisseria meningitidis]|uniref:hypothetical protein n=1 Tax=Neisseria meningitidis TaxID=487 RepID=UPI001E54909E
SIEKPQESIRKNRNPPPRHSRAGGNPETQRNRNLSEKTETPPTVIPAKAGIQKRNATGIYRKKQNPPTAVIPAKAGIQTRRHGNLPDKTVSLDSTS